MYAVASTFHVVVPHNVLRVRHAIPPLSSSSSVGAPTRWHTA
nr:hypothetical protein [Streptomyces daqingensis]